jgi:hypothetical protein
MAFVFIVLHYPEPEQREALVRSMSEMGGILRDLPGCVAAEPPYRTDDGDCIVGISKWKSREAFLSSGLELRPPDEIVEGEARPRQRFLLDEATIA